MSKMMGSVTALLSIGFLAACATLPIQSVKVPTELLKPAPRPNVPPRGANNKQVAGFVLAQSEWMDGAAAQIETLAELICTFTGQDCG